MKVPRGLSWNLSNRFHARLQVPGDCWKLSDRFQETAGSCLTGSTRSMCLKGTSTIQWNLLHKVPPIRDIGLALR